MKRVRTNKTGQSVNWDDQAKSTWFHDAETRLFISYESERSVDAKVAYVKEQRLAGLFFWELSGDDKLNPLIQHASATLL
jgi:chitinase